MYDVSKRRVVSDEREELIGCCESLDLGDRFTKLDRKEQFI